MTYQEHLSNNYQNPFYVYAYLRTNSSKTADAGTPYYIGMGKGNRAWTKHHGSHAKPPTNTDNIVILFANLTQQEAWDLEASLIKQYGRKDLGTGILNNMLDGGTGGGGFSEEARQKMSAACKAAWNDPEYREARTKERQAMWDDPEFKSKRISQLQSEEFRLQAKEKATGKVQSEETKLKRSNSLTGHLVSDKTKQAVSKTMLGKPKSTGHRLKLGAKAINAFKNGETITFDSVADCGRSIGSSPGNIVACLKGKQKTVKGFSFSYVE